MIPDRVPLPLSRGVLSAQWAYLDPQWRAFSSATEQCLPLVFREGQWLDVASQARVCNYLDKGCNSQTHTGSRRGFVAQEVSKSNSVSTGLRSLLSAPLNAFTS